MCGNIQNLATNTRDLETKTFKQDLETNTRDFSEPPLKYKQDLETNTRETLPK